MVPCSMKAYSEAGGQTDILVQQSDVESCPPAPPCQSYGQSQTGKPYDVSSKPNVSVPGFLEQGTVSADYNTIFSQFQWRGTAPSCNGSCGAGEVNLDNQSNEDDDCGASFGSECTLGGTKALCGTPSACNTCPPVGGAVSYSNKGATSTCTWDAFAVQTESDLVDLNGKTASNQIPTAAADVLSANYCFTPVTSDDCGFDMTGKKIEQCARFRTSPACQEWAKNAINRTTAEGRNVLSAAMAAYCAANKKNADCDCLQAQDADPSGSTYEIRKSYNELQQAISEPAGCWYAPCNPETSYALVDPTTPVPKCPKPLCEVVVTAGDDSKIDLNKNVITQKCVGKETGDPKLMYIVLGVAGGLLLIVIIVVIVTNNNMREKLEEAKTKAELQSALGSPSSATS